MVRPGTGQSMEHGALSMVIFCFLLKSWKADQMTSSLSYRSAQKQETGDGWHQTPGTEGMAPEKVAWKLDCVVKLVMGYGCKQ